MVHGTWHGHPISLIDPENEIWVYQDTGQRVSENPSRACGHCKLAATPEGHDGCLGELPGVMNACCGHGVDEEAYIQYCDGTDLRGRKAAEVMRTCTGGSKNWNGETENAFNSKGEA